MWCHSSGAGGVVVSYQKQTFSSLNREVSQPCPQGPEVFVSAASEVKVEDGKESRRKNCFLKGTQSGERRVDMKGEGARKQGAGVGTVASAEAVASVGPTRKVV